MNARKDAGALFPVSTRVQASDARIFTNVPMMVCVPRTNDSMLVSSVLHSCASSARIAASCSAILGWVAFFVFTF